MGTPVIASQPGTVSTATMADDDVKRKEELNNQLKEYISEWRKTREKEEDELSKLKEKQAKRKETRAEQEKKLAQQKKEEEERLRKEEAEKKAKEAEEKKKRLEEAEMKRQAMMQAQKPKNSWKKRRKSPFPSESNPSMSMPWTPTNFPARPRSFGTPLSDLRPRNTISRKGRRGRTTTLKSSRRDRNNN